MKNLKKIKVIYLVNNIIEETKTPEQELPELPKIETFPVPQIPKNQNNNKASKIFYMGKKVF